jgi:peptide/nickel transport system substrate-binding protein
MNDLQSGWSSKRGRRLLGLAAPVIATSLALAGCAGGSASSDGTASSSSNNGTLTIATAGTTQSGLNPALFVPGVVNLFYEPAYDPLIYQASDGTYKPDLATSWGYVGAGNTTFQMTIRSGVHFSDGSLVTPEAVAKYVLYYKNAGGPNSKVVANLKSADVSGDTVTLKFSSANPSVPYLLSQNGLVGDIVSPTSLDNPKSLQTSTNGAGPYMLDASATVPLHSYTYVRNPHYWNPSAVHYQKVVVNVISDPSALLSAVETGQADAGIGALSTADAAKNAGVEVLTSPGYTVGVALADRNGTVSGPLSNQSVRQALNYAIDRSSIAKGLFKSYGSATAQYDPPGSLSYDPNKADFYSYDQNKAKSLLASAGYPDGFSMSMICMTQQPTWCQIAQTLADQWGKIGVKLNIVPLASPDAYTPAVQSHKYPVNALNMGGNGPSYLHDQSITSQSLLANPYGTTDPQLTSLLGDSAVQSGDQQVKSAQAFQDRLLDLAWFAPIAVGDNVFYLSKKLQNATVSNESPLWSPFGPTADTSWQTK